MKDEVTEQQERDRERESEWGDEQSRRKGETHK